MHVVHWWMLCLLGKSIALDCTACRQCRAPHEPGNPQILAWCCRRSHVLVTPCRWVDALRQHSFAAQLGVQAEGGQLPTAVALSPKKKSILQLQREYSLANLQDFLKGLLGNALVPRALEVGRPTCLRVSAKQHVQGVSASHAVDTALSVCLCFLATVQPACPHMGACCLSVACTLPQQNRPCRQMLCQKPRIYAYVPAEVAPVGGRWGGSEAA